MKKLFSLVLALCLMASMVCFAAAESYELALALMACG